MFGNDHKLVGGFNIPQNYSTISDTVDHVSHVEPSFQVGLKLGQGTVIFLVRNPPAGKRRSMESTVTDSSKISREPSVSCCRGFSKKMVALKYGGLSSLLNCNMQRPFSHFQQDTQRRRRFNTFRMHPRA